MNVIPTIKRSALFGLCASLLPLTAAELVLEHVEPCNVLFAGEHQGLSARVAEVDGPLAVSLQVRDYAGEVVLDQAREADPGTDDGRVRWDLAGLGNGYYEATVTAAGAEAVAASFGIAPKITRSAQAVREGGYRFGLKMWYLGDAWWRNDAQWDERQATRATVDLGLQWTRAQMQQSSHLATVDLIRDYPMNVILKVESFPESCWDEERYGALEDWIALNGKAWRKKTVPRKDRYQPWLREVLAGIPPEQNVFEIWNEAWDKMSPEDLAAISNMVTEVILADRPDAIIGPNLLGSTSEYQYDARFIEAGGMEGMRMVALHPYGKSEDRAMLRRYQAWLAERLGREIDIYVTEYGSHSTPEGPHQRSEAEQAQRVVRQSLMLYAEDVKAFTPHWMGQREHERTYHEHWFGFYRLNHQPKPNLMALATCARAVDASEYRGDLWLGEGIGAMVFTRDGVNTLALFTKDGSRTVSFEPGATDLTLVDMVGAERQLAVEGGLLELAVSKDVVYLVGIGDELAATATTELDPRRWPEPEVMSRTERTVARMAAPVVDGDLAEWQGAFQMALVNPKVNGADASGIGYLGWDPEHLYIAIQMRDNQIMNKQARPKLYREDSLEIFLSTEPRDENGGYGPNDRQYWATPTSGEEQPIFAWLSDREAGTLVDIEGGAWYAGATKAGWVAELAIPWSALPPFEPKAGARLALELRVNDADTSHERWKIDPEDAGRAIKPSDPTTWSIMVLEAAR